MFNKKYTAGITSFAGIAINNVKAANNEKKVHIRVGNNVYYKTGDTAINIGAVKSLEGLFNLISNLGKIGKDGNAKTNILDFAKSKEICFVKKVKIGNDETNKLSDDFKIDISSAKGDVEITLVPKRECIKFKYTKNGKQLSTAKEDELLKSVVQGGEVNKIVFANILKDEEGNAKFENESVKSSTKKIGSEVELFNSEKKCIFEIDSSKIEGTCKTKKVICNFDNDVKLVDRINLEPLYNLDLTEIAKKNLNFAEVITKLKTVNYSVGSNTVTFFNDNFGFTVINGKSNMTIKKNENSKKFDDADFIVLDGIKAADINPIFLKKNFTVEFDNSGNNDKKVKDNNILTKIQDALNKEFSDKVVIKVSEITSEISKVHTSKANDIIKADAFTANLDNISIVGVGNKVNGKLGPEDMVNSKDITVKLKEGIFDQGVVKTVFNFDVNFDDVKKGDKGLISDIVQIINNLNGTIKEFESELEIECFLNDANKAFNDYFLQGQKLGANDFDFSNCKKNEKDANLNQSGTIKAKQTIVGKLKDECFGIPQKPKGKTDSSSNSTGSGDNNGGKKSEKGCCNCPKK